MEIKNSKLEVQTKGENDMVDITSEVAAALARSLLTEGFVNLFVPGSTGALTTIEYEEGLMKDFPAMLERVAPKNIAYEHEKRWHDGNGHSHVRAALVGPSLTVPFRNSKLQLGQWQQIVFVELDITPRKREVVVQLVGTRQRI